MKPDDPHIKWLEAPELGLAEKLYLPLMVQGLTTTVRHLVGCVDRQDGHGQLSGGGAADR